MSLSTRGSVFEKLLAETRHALADTDSRLAAFDTCSRLLPEFAFPRLRTLLFRLTGPDIRQDSALLGRVNIIGPRGCVTRLRIGSRTIIAPGVTFGLDASISIGHGVSIGPGATLHTGTHALGPGSQRMSPTPEPRSIVIDDGVWIGMHALVLPGVRIGQGAVVAAGAVVLEDVAPNTLVAGNPARVVRELPLGDR
jgi:maltose O-acetyltransferase